MPAIVQKASIVQNSGGTTTTAISFASLPQVGNAIIVLWNTRSNVALSTLADNQTGNTYTSVITNNYAPSALDSEIWWLPSVVGSAGTFTITGTLPSANPTTICALEVSGLTGVVDVISPKLQQISGTSATITAGSANVVSADLVIASINLGFTTPASNLTDPCTFGGSGGGTSTSIFFIDRSTTGGTYNGTAEASYKITTSTETDSASWTWTPSVGVVGVMVSFKGVQSWTRVGYGSWSNTFGGAVSPNIPSGNVGDLILLFSHEDIGSDPPPIVSGYTTLAANTNAHQLMIYGRIATGSDSISVNWGAAAWTWAVVGRYRDKSGTAQMLVNASADNAEGGINRVQFPGMTITAANSLVLAYGARNKTATTDGGSFTAMSNFSIASSNVPNGAHATGVINEWIQTPATSLSTTNQAYTSGDGSQADRATIIALTPFGPPSCGGIFVIP